MIEVWRNNIETQPVSVAEGHDTNWLEISTFPQTQRLSICMYLGHLAQYYRLRMRW